MWDWVAPHHKPSGSSAKWALGPLSSGSKDDGTHNVPLFLGWNFALFQLGKTLCFKPRVWKIERMGKLMRTSNASECEACLVIKLVDSARFPICL